MTAVKNLKHNYSQDSEAHLHAPSSEIGLQRQMQNCSTMFWHGELSMRSMGWPLVVMLLLNFYDSAKDTEN